MIDSNVEEFLGKADNIFILLNMAAKRARQLNTGSPKLVDIKGIKHRASLCPVVIEGDPVAISFAWNVGAGHLTGSCFGALK